MTARALIVVAKEPLPGATKTRLSPPLTPEQAVALYRCLLLDTLALMARVPGVTPLIAYLPDSAAGYFRGIAPAGFGLLPQVGADLAQRLDNVLSHCLHAGYEQAVVMNSDGPTLPAAHLTAAFDCLDDPNIDVVLGPCEDGGYYLVGLKHPCPALFEVAMSTPTVLQDTLAQARTQGLTVSLLPAWYDVDVHEDLARLRADVLAAPDEVAAHTRAFLRTLASEP